MQKVLIFALLLSGLFFSSFVISQTSPPSGLCSVGSPLAGVGCIIPAQIGTIYNAERGTDKGSGTSPNDALSNLIKGYTSKTSSCNGNGTQSRTIVGTPIVSGGPTFFSGSFTAKFTCVWQQWNSQTQSMETLETSTQSSITGISISPTSGPICPPSGTPAHEPFTLPIKHNNKDYCSKSFDPVTCPTEPDGTNYFHVGQKGGGKVCLENDFGDSCPYKEEGTSGFYTADYSDPLSCIDTPPDPPNDNQDCSLNGAGQQVCAADPDEKCQSKNGLLECEVGCGFLNGVFKCFKEPDQPEEPEEPEVPDPQIDDSITDPDKLVPEMTKSDLKSTFRGLETRLDSTKKELEDVQKNDDQNSKAIVSAINNLGRKVDKTNKELEGISETLENSLTGDELDETGLSDESAIKAGLGITGNEKLTDLKNGEFSIDSFQSAFTPFLSGGQCPAPRQISIYGKSYQLEWEAFCEFFSILGYLVMATAYILVPFIVFGGKK